MTTMQHNLGVVELENCVLRGLRDHAGTWAAPVELAGELDLPPYAVREALRDLSRRRQVIRGGDGHWGEYQITTFGLRRLELTGRHADQAADDTGPGSLWEALEASRQETREYAPADVLDRFADQHRMDRSIVHLVRRCPDCDGLILACHNQWLDVAPTADGEFGVIELGPVVMAAAGAIDGGSRHRSHQHQPGEPTTDPMIGEAVS